MKIAVLAHLHYPIAQPYAGGMETHTALLVHELQRQGHEVTLYASAGSDVELNVVPIFSGDAEGGKPSLVDTAYYEALRQIDAEPYDYIINNTLNTVPIRHLSSGNVPVLTIFHSPPMEKVVKLASDILDAPNMYYAAVSHVTAAQWAAKIKVDVEVVHNGIDVENWLSTYANRKQNYLAWSGRITPEKGTHIAIEAAQLIGIPIKLAGTIYDKKYFDEVITPLLKKPGADYIGHLKLPELNAHYGHAKVALVTPLWDEPFGLVAIEALASGTPVAAINNGAMPEIITSRVGSLAQFPTAESMAKAIQLAMGKDSAQCVELVQSCFTIKTMVDQYSQIMERGVVRAATIAQEAELENLTEGDIVYDQQLV